MWDRWKQSVVGRKQDGRQARQTSGPPDLGAVPAVPVGDPDGLLAVDPFVLSRYLGMTVLRVEPADQVTGERPPGGWLVTFENGHRAAIQVLPLGDQRSAFPSLRARYIQEHGRQGAQEMPDSLTLGTIGTINAAPYETYYQGGVLAARGRRLDVLARADQLGTPRFHETLAGLAAVALRIAEG